MERQYSALDRVIASIDEALRISTGGAPAPQRPNPAGETAAVELDEEQRRHAAGLMRINHAGEICAQALYAGQAATARNDATREAMQSAADEEIDHQLKLIMDIARRHNPVELREAKDADEAGRIWLGRKSAFGAIGQINDYMCLDGTIPVSSLPYVLRRIGEVSEEFGLQVGNVFHAGDGNMHPLILFDANKPGDLETCEAFGAEILKLCVEVGGCLTGEHGVGIEKRDLMDVQYSGTDLEAQMRVKDVFDPDWLLNPAKVFPLAITEAVMRGM